MLADVMRCGELRIHIAILGESQTFVLRGRDRVVDEVLVAECASDALDHVVSSGDWKRYASQREFVADNQLGERCDDSQLKADLIDLRVGSDRDDEPSSVLDHRDIAV